MPKYYDENSKKRTMKYMKANVERITVWVKKGDKERYKQLAEKNNESLNGLIVRLLSEEENKQKSPA